MTQKTTYILLAAVVVAAPLAVGAVHTAVVLGLAAAMVILVAIQARIASKNDRNTVAMSLPSMAFLAMATMCVAQLIPLPGGLVEWLSPRRWAHVARGWQVLFADQAPADAWMPLSVAPERTADRGLRWLVLAAVAFSAANLGRLTPASSQKRDGSGRRDRPWRAVLRIGVAAGLAVLAVGALQVAAGADKILFVYRPAASIKDYTTFVSPNHAAVFFGFSALCSLALGLRSIRRRPVEAALASLAGVVLMVAMTAQNSVGATVGFWAALVALFGFFLQSKQSRAIVSRSWSRWLAAGLFSLPILAPAAAFLAWRFGPASWAQALGETHVGQWLGAQGGGRLEMMAAGVDAAADYPLVGAGAGATGRALGAYLDWSTLPVGSVPTIENEPVEWLFEFGWPLGLVACALLVGYLVYAFRGHRHGRRLRYGVALSVGLYLAFNAQFHFPFFTLGIAIPMVCVLEAALARASGGRDASEEAGFRAILGRGRLRFGPGRTRWLLAAGAGVLLAGLLGALAAYRIDDSTVAPPNQPTSHDGVARRLRWTPTDSDFFAHQASFALDDGQSGRAVALAEHAAELAPTAKMLLFLADTRWRAGRRRPAIEAYRRVFSPEFPKVRRAWVGRYLVATVAEPAAIAQALDRATPDQWRAAAVGIHKQFSNAAQRAFAVQLIDAHPEAGMAYKLLIQTYLRDHQHQLAEMWARLFLSKATPKQSALARTLLAKSLWGERAKHDARAQLAAGLADAPANPNLAGLAVRYRSDRPARAEPGEAGALQTISDNQCNRPDNDRRRRWCWLTEGWLAERDGRIEDAQFAYERVLRKLDRPEPLAEFLARQHKCVQLNQLIAELRQNNDARAGRLRRLTKTCGG